jgi:monofunctional biosynthetic peptidoglycan transglycosylase
MTRLVSLLRRLVVGIALIVLFVPVAVVAIYRFVPVPITPLMVIRWVEGDGLTRTWTPWQDISPNVPEAVIAAEDNRFCVHVGFDWKALSGQIERAAGGGRPRGASTLSNQVAKNLLLWPGRDLLRKGLEAYITVVIESLWPKQRIAEVYLNIVEWGRGIFGIGAAAEFYFKTTPDKLSRFQAAQLAAVLPNPKDWRANPPSRFVANRARVLIRRVRQLGSLLDCVRSD